MQVTDQHATNVFGCGSIIMDTYNCLEGVVLQVPPQLKVSRCRGFNSDFNQGFSQ